MKIVGVAAAQTSKFRDQIQAATQYAIDVVVQAEEKNAPLICLPECFLQGYLTDEPSARRVAFDLRSEAFGSLLSPSSLKPVPSLQQQLILDQSLTCGTETYSTDHSLSDAKLAEPPVNLVREGSVLAPVELQEAAPFHISEVSPSDHDKCLSVEQIDDSTILSFEGIEQPILEWLDYGITPAIIIGRLERETSTRVGVKRVESFSPPSTLGSPKFRDLVDARAFLDRLQ